MKNKVLKLIVLTFLLILLYIPSSYAAGATVKASKTEIKPGDTVELYVDLSTTSIGYDIKFSESNKSLISSSEVVSKIGQGDTSRIYLIQIESEENRVKHPAGTRIATLKYKIADTAKAGDTLTINVKGDIAGESSAEKNTMDESVTLKVAQDNTQTQQDQTKEQEKTTDKTQTEQKTNTDEKSNTQNSKDTNANNNSSQEQQTENNNPAQPSAPQQVQPQATPVIQATTNQGSGDITTTAKKLPNTGYKRITVLLVVVVIINIICIKKYFKYKDIK